MESLLNDLGGPGAIAGVNMLLGTMVLLIVSVWSIRVQSQLKALSEKIEKETVDAQKVFELIKKHDSHFSTLATALTNFQTISDNCFKRIDRNVAHTEQLVTGVRDYLSESNSHLDRLQEGYDYAVLKRTVRYIIYALQVMDDAGSTAAIGEKELGLIRAELLDCLTQNGVERFEVAAGEHFSEVRKMAEAIPEKEVNRDPERNGTVSKMLRAGYRYIFNDDQQRLIQPAKVKLYEKA